MPAPRAGGEGPVKAAAAQEPDAPAPPAADAAATVGATAAPADGDVKQSPSLSRPLTFVDKESGDTKSGTGAAAPAKSAAADADASAGGGESPFDSFLAGLRRLLEGLPGGQGVAGQLNRATPPEGEMFRSCLHSSGSVVLAASASFYVRACCLGSWLCTPTSNHPLTKPTHPKQISCHPQLRRDHLHP